MIITLGINSLTAVAQPAYSNHIQFMFKLGKHYPNLNLVLHNPSRMSIDRMRNSTARIAMDVESDYLMFIDDDILLPINLNVLQELIDCDADIAAGDVLIRGNGFPHMAFKKDENGGLKIIESFDETDNDIVPVDAVGFSLVLIKTSFLKKVPGPWFVTGPSNTEDIYFCLKSRKYQPDCKIVVNRKIECAHIVGYEAVTLGNREAYNQFISTMEKSFKDKHKQNSGDRGDEYVEMVESKLDVKS